MQDAAAKPGIYRRKTLAQSAVDRPGVTPTADERSKCHMWFHPQYHRLQNNGRFGDDFLLSRIAFSAMLDIVTTLVLVDS